MAATAASTNSGETATNANNNSILDTSSQNGMSEYTVNTTVTTNQQNPANSLLQDVAISQEQMESALTVGSESLHE